MSGKVITISRSFPSGDTTPKELSVQLWGGRGGGKISNSIFLLTGKRKKVNKKNGQIYD